jgi:hypothetical protein
MLDNRDQSMKNEKCYSQLSTYSKTHMAFGEADDLLVCSNKN